MEELTLLKLSRGVFALVIPWQVAECLYDQDQLSTFRMVVPEVPESLHRSSLGLHSRFFGFGNPNLRRRSERRWSK